MSASDARQSETPVVKSRLRGDWVDDGHRVVAQVDYDDVRLRIECPGDGCRADRMACGFCEGTAEGCTHCNETGVEPKVSGFCWLRDMAPEFDFIEAFHVGSRDDVGDGRIVYKIAYDEWEWVLRRHVVEGEGSPR